MASIWGELRRRNVFRAGIAYLVSAWLVVEIASVFLPVFNAAGWILQVLMIALALGLPIALVFSWFFEISADGIKRTDEIAQHSSAGQLFDRRVDFVIISLLVGGLLFSLYGNFRGTDAPPESVSILIADFDNQTENELFSGVIEAALLVGLELAPFIDTFSRTTAVSMAAELPGTSTDAAGLGLQPALVVALRRGIDLVIAGTVLRDNSGVTVIARGISPIDQEELFVVTESVGTDPEIMNAVAKVSAQLRLELGDNENRVRSGEPMDIWNLEAAAEYVKANQLQRERQLEESIVYYERAIEFDPDFARAYAGLALSENYLGRMEESAQHWEEALSRLDTVTERGRLITLGNYYNTNRDYENALETYERLEAAYPLTSRNSLAVAAFYSMDFQRALEVGREIVERNPGLGVRANLALYAMYAGRLAEASEVARDIVEEAPVAYAFLVLALTHAVSGDLAAAEDIYDRMLEIGQYGRSVAFEGLADLAVYQGNFEAAISLLATGIEDDFQQNAGHSAALKQVMRAETLLRMEDPAEALSNIDAAIPSAAGDPAVLVPAALSLVEIGDLERAESIAAELSTSLAKSDRAYAGAIRARVAGRLGQPGTGIEFASQALELTDLWLIRFIRGNLYFQAGQIDEAVADLEVCRDRIGEGIAVFLNDRPSFRLLADLDEASAAIGALD